MDHFALGGVLINETDIGSIVSAHTDFTARWKLTGPLHSTKIRGGRGAFSWLAAHKGRANAFFGELDQLILNAPIMSISCVIDRPGYVARYAQTYPKPWLLCQTAFAILVERASKYARRHEGRLVVYFEQAGKREDRGLLQYMKALKSVGMPFPGSAASGYDSLSAEDFRSIVPGEPSRVTKKVPMIQFADLVLYAMARGGYDEQYPPFRALHTHGRIIDATLEPKDVPRLGVKYSCFENEKGPDVGRAFVAACITQTPGR